MGWFFQGCVPWNADPQKGYWKIRYANSAHIQGTFPRGPIISKHTWLQGSYFEKHPEIVSNTVETALYLALGGSIFTSIYQLFYFYIYSDLLDKKTNTVYIKVHSLLMGQWQASKQVSSLKEGASWSAKQQMGKDPQALSDKRDETKQNWARNTFNDQKQHSGTC